MINTVLGTKVTKMKSSRQDLPRDQYQTKCYDCGRFVPRARWIPINGSKGKKPLCIDCQSMYDDPAFF